MKNDLYLLELDNALVLNNCRTSDEYNRIVYSYYAIDKEWQRRVLSLLFPLFKCVLVVGSFFYVTIFFVIKLVGSLFKRKPIKLYDIELFFFFLPKFYNLCKQSSLYESSKYWVCGGVINADNYDLSEKTIVRYQDYVSFSDNFVILKHCYHSIWQYIKKYHCYYPMYKTWDFYETYIGVKKMASECGMCFANQSDRWAMLFDAIPSRKKTLLQHGIASNKIQCSARLSNIDVFYAISENTVDDVLFSILDCKPEIRIMKSKLPLTEVEGDKKVLVISHIVWFNLEKYLIKNLMELGVDIYLKKHPEVKNDQCYVELKKEYNFYYITDSMFPRVDCVISYPSTLAYEYRESGIPVFIYNPEENLPINEIKAFVEKETR